MLGRIRRFDFFTLFGGGRVPQRSKSPSSPNSRKRSVSPNPSGTSNRQKPPIKVRKTGSGQPNVAVREGSFIRRREPVLSAEERRRARIYNQPQRSESSSQHLGASLDPVPVPAHSPFKFRDVKKHPFLDQRTGHIADIFEDIEEAVESLDVSEEDEIFMREIEKLNRSKNIAMALQEGRELLHKAAVYAPIGEQKRKAVAEAYKLEKEARAIRQRELAKAQAIEDEKRRVYLIELRESWCKALEEQRLNKERLEQAEAERVRLEEEKRQREAEQERIRLELEAQEVRRKREARAALEARLAEQARIEYEHFLKTREPSASLECEKTWQEELAARIEMWRMEAATHVQASEEACLVEAQERMLEMQDEDREFLELLEKATSKKLLLEKERREREAAEKKIRLELKAHEEQQQKEASAAQEARLECYRLYDEKWKILQSGRVDEGSVLGFEWPWPVLVPVSTVQSPVALYYAIRQFLFHPRRPNPEGKSRKACLEAELFRWHPDNFGPVLAKVCEMDREAVSNFAAQVLAALTRISQDAA